MFMTPDDKKEHGALFVRYRTAGDVRAFETLVECYRIPLHTYLTRMLGRPERAEDAFQEVWLRVIRRADTYEEQGQFSSWLYRIAHNHGLDEYRRQSRENTVTEPDMGPDVSFWSTVPDPQSTSPAEHTFEREVQACIEDAVAALPQRLRDIYLLRTVSDVPFKELAVMLDCPLGTVLGWMHQAMKRIRNHLAARGVVDEKPKAGRRAAGRRNAENRETVEMSTPTPEREM